MYEYLGCIAQPMSYVPHASRGGWKWVGRVWVELGNVALHVEVQPKPNPPFINCCEDVGLNHLNP